MIATGQITYLDNNASTRVDPRVLERMMPLLTEQYGNPSSVHRFGAEVLVLVEKARAAIARAIGAAAHEVLFTSGGTESDNAALHGVLAASPGKRHIVTTPIEHHAVREHVAHLEQNGVAVTRVPVSADGLPDLTALEAAIRPDTAVVVAMLVNNETGAILPLKEIAAIAHARRVPVLSDGVNALGKMSIDVADLGVDFLTLSAHKVHGPKGIGALYIRKGTPWEPFVIGGPQERRRRGGTHNTAGIVGFGAACEVLAECVPDAWTQMAQRRDRLEAEISRQVPGVHVIAAGAPRVPNTSCLCFEKAGAEAILLMLSEFGICASSGSACSSGALEASPVLAAMGVPPEVARGQIRLSLSRFTTDEEIDRVIEHLPRVLERVRKSPL